ncbi:MAG: glycine cleavage system aminomethyltransferase GcvT [Deltaproteobacteria bacterium]|nr:glycine cleavage system aminomethyltransferase GcvT [Deltaproteobacteria bacterium]MBI4373349.1 glycine cleavage system aminomethyltransferase GcvT [Deltaproteobacteria bacterium]
MKTTPLNSLHKQLGAKMVDFAGWEMPVQYSGIREEHLAVRTRAGLFDVSHMGEIEVRGPRALELVQRVACNDAGRLVPGRSQYSGLLNPEGRFVDDVMVYCLAKDHFLICVNASNADKDFEWIQKNSLPGAEILNRSDAWGLIALQGPLARKILPSPLKKNHFSEEKLFECPVLLSGTGYTGEDGFEIFCATEEAPRIWKGLLENGRSAGLIPCGLGARDTLRIEACYPLYGHEIDDQTTPFEAGLDWIVKMEKGDFIGRSPLSREKKRKEAIGLKLQEPGIARQGYKLFFEGKEVGWVTSGTLSPLTGEAIALGTVNQPLTKETVLGNKIGVQIREKMKAAVVVSTPFYERAK